MTKFRNGDVVRFRSGSPDLTIVYRCVDPDLFGCEWFTANGTRKCEVMDGEYLTLVRAAPRKRVDLAPLAGMRMPESWRRANRYYENWAAQKRRLQHDYDFVRQPFDGVMAWLEREYENIRRYQRDLDFYRRYEHDLEGIY